MFTDDTQFCVSSFFLLDFCSAYRAENLRYHIKHGQNFIPQFRQIVGLMCASRFFFLFIACLRTPHIFVRRSFICSIFALLIAPKICASYLIYNRFFVIYFNAIFPFPQVFSLSPFPLASCKGTHGDCVAGGNSTRLTQGVTIAIPSLRSLRSRHNLRHFSYYATSPAWQLRNRTPRILVLHTQGLPHVKNKRTCV